MLSTKDLVLQALCLALVASASARVLSSAQPAQVPSMDLPVTERGTAAATAAAAPPSSPAAAYSSFDEALKAASSSTTNNLSTLLEAVKVAGVTSALNLSTAWTILMGAAHRVRGHDGHDKC